MKRFLINCLFFASIFFLFNQIPSYFIDPYYGNNTYSAKHQYFMSHLKRFNTVFMGSSRINHQVNPAQFDRHLRHYGISSFNLASEATTNPEMYFLCEKLIESLPKGSIRYILLELQPIQENLEKNLNTRRNYYWHNFEYLLFILRYAQSSNSSISKKIEISEQYTKSYFLKLKSNINDFFLFFFDNPRGNRKSIGQHQDGFLPLETSEPFSKKNPGYQRLVRDLYEHPEHLKRRERRARKQFRLKETSPFLNVVHLEKTRELIQLAKAKDIELIYVIAPKSPDYLSDLAIRDKLPKGHVIEVANPDLYPELYQRECAIDIGHLNNRGLFAFTRYLAENFAKYVLDPKMTPDQ